MTMRAPTPFKQIGPDHLRIKEGGGCTSVFGIPFFVAGLFITLVGGRIVPVENSAQIPPWGWPLIIIMGLIFAAVGGGLTFGRRWTIFDKSRGIILKQWGLLIPMRQEQHSLQSYKMVAIRFDPGDSDTADRYPVVLRAADEQADLILCSSTEYSESRNRAAYIAKFLHYSLVDASTEHESVFDPERVDQTFQERVHSRNDLYENAARPIFMRSQVSENAVEVRILIPGSGFKWTKLLGLVIPATIIAFVIPHLLQFFRQTRTPEFVQVFFLGFVIILLGVVPFMGAIHAIILSKRSRTLITIVAEGIEIEERGAWKTKKTKIPVGEIIDLDYHTSQGELSATWSSASRRVRRNDGSEWQPKADPATKPWWYKKLSQLAKSKGIIVKSTKGMFSFGAGLPDEEVRYLYSVAKAALAG